ncbi:hypothetical protein BGX23_002761, partial [Mortierella sp. AD031]
MHILPTNGKLATVAMLATMSVLPWTNTAWANIEFIKQTLPNVNPGDPMTLTWTQINPAVGVPLNTVPFNLVLRALSGQTYLIQAGVAQSALSIKVNVPTNATGGKHSYLCDYQGKDGLKGTSTGQFNISGKVVPLPPPTTTQTATSTTTSVTLPTTATSGPDANGENKSSEGGGLSTGALAGIIGGVAAFLLFLAAIFFFRHRRLVRERNEHAPLKDTKEGIHEPQVVVTARSGPPPSGPPGQHGPHDGGMVPIPLGGPNEFQRKHSNDFGSPRSQHQMQHLGGSGNGGPNNNGRNPFDSPEDPMMGPGMARSLSPREQHQPYQPPALNQSPRPPPYGVPNGHPGMQQQQHNQSPFQQSNRDSFESEIESAYDPNQARMTHNNNNFSGNGNGPIQRNNSNAMMQHGRGPLSHSPSSRSMNSNMSPPHRHQQQQQQQQSKPFQDRELMAAAAGGIAVANAHHGGTNSPSMAHRQLPSNHAMGSPRIQSPMMRAIEMQPLDVQQHQYEQQQRALARQQQQKLQQQQQQQQQQQEQPLSPVQPLQVQHQAVPPPQMNVATTSAPAPAAPAPEPAPGAHLFNPMLYDDKTEVDEDGTPVYNGYRDTIFGAYVHTPGDDDDDESGSDEGNAPVPIVPSSAIAQA